MKQYEMGLIEDQDSINHPGWPEVKDTTELGELFTGKRLMVSEIFGPVIQGEGIMAGQTTMFLRLAGCDYRCKWCDTLKSVLPELIKENHTKMSVVDILSELTAKHNRIKTVTVSGGNPAIHDLGPLITRLQVCGWTVAVETQGSVNPPWFNLVDVLTLSPKPPSSGNITESGKIVDILERLDIDVSRVCIKIVVFDEEDYRYAKAMYQNFGYSVGSFYFQPGTSQIWKESQPETAVMALIQSSVMAKTVWLAEKVLADGLENARVMPQLHALMYGYREGV